MLEIKCADCGAPRKTTQANTRYCRLCAAIRAIEYWTPDKARRCGEQKCKRRFVPTKRGDFACGHCDYRRHRGTCAICKGDDVPIWLEGIAVCLVCAKDPQARLTLIKALLKKQGATQAT